MKFLNRNIVIALALLLLGVLIWSLSDIVGYVLIAWVLSLLGQPMMRFWRRLRLGKWQMPISLAATLTILSFLGAFALLIGLFVPLVVTQANNLSQVNWQGFSKSLEVPLAQLTDTAQRFGLLANGQTAPAELEKFVKTHLDPTRLTGIFGYVLSMTSSLLVGIVSVLFITFFFLGEHSMMVDFLASILPRRYEGNVRESVEDTTTLLSRYFGGLLLQMAFVTAFLCILLFICGVKNFLLIAVFAAIINVVPFLGPLMGCVFALFITVCSNLDLDFYSQMSPLLWRVFIIFVSMQMVNDWLVQPLIFSNRVKAHPLEIFLVTLIGAKFAGITGMILAIPAYTVLRVVARAFFKEYRFIQKMTDSLDEA